MTGDAADEALRALIRIPTVSDWDPEKEDRARRTGGVESRVRGAAGLLVAGLELGVIAGALTSGALAESVGMTGLLALPAVVVTLALAAIRFGVEESPVLGSGGVDWRGFRLVTFALALVMSGLVMLRVMGPGSPWPWLVVVVGVLAFVPFVRAELAHPAPLVDLRVLSARGQWPVQATAFLFGVSCSGRRYRCRRSRAPTPPSRATASVPAPVESRSSSAATCCRSLSVRCCCTCSAAASAPAWP